MGAHSVCMSAVVELAGAAAGAAAGATDVEVGPLAGCAGALESMLVADFAPFESASLELEAGLTGVVAVAVTAAFSSPLPLATCAARTLVAPTISKIPAPTNQDFIPASVPSANTPPHPDARRGLTRVVKNTANRNGLLARSRGTAPGPDRREFGIISGCLGRTKSFLCC